MTDWRNDSYWLALKEDAPRLLNQIRQLGAAEEEAKDLLQETLIRVLQARDRYDGRVPVGAFAFGFAVRVVANSRAGSVRRNRFLARYASEQRPTTSDPAARYEVAERVRLALERLSFNHRAVLVALDIERMTVPELALALGMNENTLYTRHREARAKFREALDAVDRGGGLMSRDPNARLGLEEALDVLRRASEKAAAEPGDLRSILDSIELQLDDLPILPELPPALADEDWDAPNGDDVPPDDSGGDGGGDPSGSGTPPGDAGIGASAVDGAGLTSLISTPITLGRALLTLALPAAVLGGLAGVGGARLAAPAEAPPTVSSLAVEMSDEPRGEVIDLDAAAARDEMAPTHDVTEQVADAHGQAGSQPRSPRGGDTLTQESRLIDGARTALSRGDAASCATFVAQHRRRFPAGALVEEREALDVRCRRVAGDPSAAAAAGSFRDRFPGSPQLGSPE